MDPTLSLSESLGAAQEALADIGGADTQALTSERLVWLERQLAHLILQLQSLLSDLDAGMSIVDLGFTIDDFGEMIGDLNVEISNLRGLIRVAKAVCR